MIPKTKEKRKGYFMSPKVTHPSNVHVKNIID